LVVGEGNAVVRTLFSERQGLARFLKPLWNAFARLDERHLWGISS
jgi:hypothetical protein